MTQSHSESPSRPTASVRPERQSRSLFPGQSESAVLSEFLSAVRRLGLTPPDKLAPDGKIHRFRSGPEHALNGFYRLVVVPAHQGGEIGFGLIGCWKRDVSEKWCSREPRDISEPDRKSLEKARAELKREDASEAAEAERKAAAIWKAAAAAPADHPYLAAKKIGPKGLKLHKDLLVVPAYRDGKLASLQFIGADGVKRFLSGGRMDGAYASISGGNGDRSRIVIAEGYATGASLFEALGWPVVIAFTCSNLLPVAKIIREKYPDAQIIMAADNDQY